MPQFQPQPARLVHGRPQPAAQPVWRQHHQQGAGSTGERRQAAQPVPDPHPGDDRIPPAGQVQHQHVDGARREQRPRQRERLLEAAGHQDHQPLRAHAPRDGLHRVERPGKVQPGHDGPCRLRLRRHPEGERGPARAGPAAERHGGGPGQPAGAQHGIERGEPGGDHPVVHLCGGDAGTGGGRVQVGGRGDRGRGSVPIRLVVDRQRRDRERALDHRRGISQTPRSGRAPPCLEGCEGLGNVGCTGHRTSNNRTDVLLVKGDQYDLDDEV